MIQNHSTFWAPPVQALSYVANLDRQKDRIYSSGKSYLNYQIYM